MQYEFLKNFPKRMKNVGLYGVLIQNSIQKTSWKQFGFLKFDEQMNLIFAVMLYIMEQTLITLPKLNFSHSFSHCSTSVIVGTNISAL